MATLILYQKLLLFEKNECLNVSNKKLKPRFYNLNYNLNQVKFDQIKK